MRRMAARIGVTQRLRLVESALVDVPSVIGFVRPAVIVPVSVLANLPPAQLEAILAHELAHIRRGDYFINLLQSRGRSAALLSPRGLVGVEADSRRARALLRRRGARVVRSRRVRARAGVARDIAGRDAGARDGRDRRRAARPDSPPRRPGDDGAQVIGMGRDDGGLTVLAVAAIRSDLTVWRRQSGSGAADCDGRRPAGRVVPGVNVTIQRSDVTGTVEAPVEIRTTLTDATGQFLFADLTPGQYALTASLPGFKSAKLRVALAANESVNGTVRLELGTLSEMITVRGASPPPPRRSSSRRRRRPRPPTSRPRDASRDAEPADRTIRPGSRGRLHQGAEKDPRRQAGLSGDGDGRGRPGNRDPRGTD